VRSVARAHAIPANQVFHWRKLYREGRLGNSEPATASELVAVRILDVQQASCVEQATKQPAITPSLGVIQIESGKGRLCIQGAADPATLRVVLERLLG
jgi:transposase